MRLERKGRKEKEGGIWKRREGGKRCSHFWFM